MANNQREYEESRELTLEEKDRELMRRQVAAHERIATALERLMKALVHDSSTDQVFVRVVQP